MKLRVTAAICACKLSRFVIRLFGRGGTNLPGLMALKLCPDLLGYLAKDVTTLVVVGTNGKTTTSRMIEQSWLDSGLSYFANKSGANLLSGVTAEFAAHSTLSGRCKYSHALIEADEAAFRTISKFVDAKIVVVTNVFRDQLDRYGEVSHTRESIKIGLINSPRAVVCLNADDSLTASLAGEIPNRIIYYGVNTPIYKSRVKELSDAPYCIRCKHKYIYDYVTYGHLGGYRCPACGNSRPEPEVYVSEVESSDSEGSVVMLHCGGRTRRTRINLPGGYNIYNACSCAAAGEAMGLDDGIVCGSLSSFDCGFGRMEKFEINQTSLRMILIKNPAGCNQVLNFLSDLTEPYLFVCCLNDNAQDGKDISWIWDVDFEKIAEMDELLTGLIVSGTRAEDMAVRFKYAGVPAAKIGVIKDYGELISACVEQDKPVFIMPTYTAMLDLRTHISRKYGFKSFWE